MSCSSKQYSLQILNYTGPCVRRELRVRWWWGRCTGGGWRGQAQGAHAGTQGRRLPRTRRGCAPVIVALSTHQAVLFATPRLFARKVLTARCIMARVRTLLLHSTDRTLLLKNGCICLSWTRICASKRHYPKVAGPPAQRRVIGFCGLENIQDP